ncbi:MAG: hypothetical protein EOL86_09470 [Deltaproteobacteria bacterium]|nr:hypothetical protein [Deltaproteobacteria bacterium]
MSIDLGQYEPQSEPRKQYQPGTQYDERPKIMSALNEVKAPDHDSFFVALACVQDALGEDGRDLAERWAQNQGESRAREFNGVWRSCHQGKGLGAGTLYQVAQQNGWAYDAPLRAMTVEQTEARRRSREEAKRLNQEEEARNLERAKLVAASVMAAAKPASENPYLKRKLVSMGYGLKSIPMAEVARILRAHSRKDEGEDLTKGRFAMFRGDELLVVPRFEGFEAEPKTVELIDAAGTKYTLKGGGAGIYSTAPFPAPGTHGLVFYVGEGAVTCLSVSEIMQGGIGVSTGSNGQLAKAAQAIRDRYPDARIILLADIIKTTGKPDQLAVKAAKLVGGSLAVPDFGPGWTADMGKDFNDLANAPGLGPDAVRKCIEAGQRQKRSRLRAFRYADLLAIPDVKWIVKGVLAEHVVGLVYGLSTVGKSFLMVDMASSIAEGREWFGFRTKKKPVVYACLEGQHGYKRRAQAWAAHNGRAYPSGVVFSPDPIDLRKDEDTDELIALTLDEAGLGAVVIVDTLNRAAPGMEENGSVDYGLILASATRLAHAVQGSVCFVGHPGKDASKGPRGHYSMFAGLEMVLRAEEVNKSDLLFSWTAEKVKDGQDGFTKHFRREVIELGVDDDGDPVTSCVIVPDPEADQEAAEAKPKTANISRTNRERFEEFRQAAMEHGTLDEDGQFIGLDKENWRAHFFEHSQAPNKAAKRSAHNTATKELKKIGLIYERADGLFQFDGPGSEAQADIIRVAIEERTRGKATGESEGRRERRDPKKSEDSSLAKDREAKRREDPPLRDLLSSHDSGQFSVEDENQTEDFSNPSSPGTLNPTGTDGEGWEDL